MVFDDDKNVRVALDHIDAIIVHTGDRLITVLERRDNDLQGAVALVFQFRESKIEVGVRAEDDSVDIIANPVTQVKPSDLRDISFLLPWKKAIGKSLAGFCIMLNNRGYVDGVQLEFSNSIMENSVYAQVIGAGALLHIRHVCEADTLKRSESPTGGPTT